MRGAGPSPSCFVGRHRELAELRGWLAEAQNGRGRLVVVHGEPGMGKTRLAEELAARASAQGISVVWSRCSADVGAPPLWPLRRIVDQLPGAHGSLPAADGDGFGSSAEGSAAARFAQSVWLADTVVDAARPAGLLVVVEDLHWADSGTAAALGHLSAELPRSRALVVVTARLLADSRAVEELAERPGIEQRQLPALDRDEIADYLSAIGGGPADERYADLVLRQTAGNSLFVAAVVRLLAERVSLRAYDEVSSRAALAGRPELVDLVREPVARVSADCRDLVETASVAGEDFSIAELAAACGLSSEAVLALLDEAVQARLLSLPADAPGTARFVHALVRDGVYDNVERAVRSRAHRALAATIAATDSGPDRIGTIASHLTRGATTPAEHLHAAGLARQAGRAALADLAYAEAAGQFRSALHNLTMAGGPSPIERTEILLDLAFAEYRSGAFGGSLEHCLIAADLAEAGQRWDLLARAALLVDGVTPPHLGESLLGLCRRARSLVPEAELSVRAQLEARFAYAAVDEGDLDRAERMSADALALAERIGDPAALIAALRARHQALAGPGHAAERLRLGSRAIDLAGRGEPLAALWGRLWRIDTAFEMGDLVAVDQELAALARLTAELRFPLARWHLARLRAAREALVGRFAIAEEHARSARELSDELEDPSVAGLHYAFQLALGYTRGEPLRDHVLDLGIEDFVALATQIRLPIALTSVAIAMVSAGDMDEAARMARQLCTEAGGWPMDGRWMVAVPMLAEVVADVADAECAEVLYPLLVPFASLAVAGGSGTVACEGSVSRPLGRLAATAGRLDAAEHHFRDAIRLEESMGGRPFAALSRMYLAEVLNARGGAANLSAAAQLARTALAAMRAMQMSGRAARCEQLLVAIDADLAERTALTSREREIVALVAEALSNRQIAERLFVSERTVETHVSHVLAKIGGSSRTDIVAWAFSAKGAMLRP